MDLRCATTGPYSGKNVQESTFARFSEQLDFRLLQQYLPKPQVSILLLGEPAPSVSTERCLFARERVRASASVGRRRRRHMSQELIAAAPFECVQVVRDPPTWPFD